jgi:hypothetical protein
MRKLVYIIIAVLIISAVVSNMPTTLEESPSASESKSENWWLNSGGKLIIQTNRFKTIQGDLSQNDPWRITYNASNPTDTDGGIHPQNIFRLITKSVWTNVRQQAYFKVHRDELSASKNRNESNGLLLFGHYSDSDDLYYAGLRVDGTAIIKKKQGGVYYILAQVPIFDGSPEVYNRESNQSLLPKNTWLGIQTEMTNENETVRIKLFVDIHRGWRLAAEAVDDGSKGGSALTAPGPAGIRTDFMDVEFKNYQIENM